MACTMYYNQVRISRIWLKENCPQIAIDMPFADEGLGGEVLTLQGAKKVWGRIEKTAAAQFS